MGKSGPIEGEEDHPACARAQRWEGWGRRLDCQAERLRGYGLALAQSGGATIRAAACGVRRAASGVRRAAPRQRRPMVCPPVQRGGRALMVVRGMGVMWCLCSPVVADHNCLSRDPVGAERIGTIAMGSCVTSKRSRISYRCPLPLLA